jgi:DNA replication protein DnaC
LLIIDELGYLPFEPDAAHLLFQLVSRIDAIHFPNCSTKL